MVNDNWQFVINQYLEDLNSLFYISSDRRDCIVTPFSRPDGEPVEILAEYTGDGFLMLSDNCTTFDYLFVNGFNVKNYEKAIDSIAKKYQIQYEMEEIYTIVSSIEKLGEQFHRLIEAILAVTYLIYKSESRYRPTIIDEVSDLFKKHRIRYTRNYPTEGLSVYKIPFYIDSGRELLIDTITATSGTPKGVIKNRLSRLMVQWLDIGENNPTTYNCISVLDDTKGMKIKEQEYESFKLLQSYYKNGKLRGQMIYWSQRDQLISLVQ
ncbi:DUF1828 domain-containing protein [Desulfobacterales bacterium HSG2]|nr:DUF1828 domain-containing protein [Desulfobacterales bacterium HSG2]